MRRQCRDLCCPHCDPGSDLAAGAQPLSRPGQRAAVCSAMGEVMEGAFCGLGDGVMSARGGGGSAVPGLG